jgi:hypothetical protein
MRAEIHEVLLLQVRLLLPLANKGVSLHESEQILRAGLEDIAATLEQRFLSSPEYQEMTDAERALYADELREVVEHMKTSTNLLTQAMFKIMK